MTHRDETSEWRSSARGEAAWKDATECVATRNEAVRRAAKLEREAYERERKLSRQAAETRPHAELLSRRRSR